MARAYPYDDSADALFRPARGASFFEDWTDKDTDRSELLCAEMSRLAYADEATARQSLGTPGFALDLWLGGPRPGARVATRGTDGFVARHAGKRLTVVAFRGTQPDSPEDLLSDLLTRAVDWNGAQVHEGFFKAFEAVRGRLVEALRDDEQGTLLITGHSLGAAVATLVAAELRSKRPQLVTFGSPRVGDGRLRNVLDEQRVQRYVNCCDVVTRVPPEAFDADHIGVLLQDITGQSFLSTAASPVLSTALRRIGIDPSFVHVVPARYADPTGRTMRTIGVDQEEGADVTAERSAARQEYREQRGSSLSIRVVSLINAVRSLLSAGRSTTALEDLRDALTGAIGGLGGQRVPIRDLADHAPINYVSLFSGRL